MKSYLKTRKMIFFSFQFFLNKYYGLSSILKGSGGVDLPASTYAREFVIATRMSVQHDWHLRSVTPFVLVCFNRHGNIGTAIFYLSVAPITTVY